MKNILKDKKKLFIIFAFIALFIVSLSCLNKEMQNDTFYNIKVGESISKYGVDMKDHFSFIPDLKYTYPHWLFDLGVFKIYDSFGFKGLVAFEFIIVYLIAISLFLTTRKLIKSDSISLLSIIFVLSFIKPFITIRAQLVSFLILILILFIIELSREKKKKRYLLYLSLLAILLANVHCATYPMIFVLYLPYLVSDLIYVIKNKISKSNKEHNIIELEKPKNTKFLLLQVLIIFICGFLTLSKDSYTYIVLIYLGKSTSLIKEHAPSSITNNPFIFIFIGIFFVMLLSKNFKIKIKDLFLILGFILLTFLSARSFALFLLLTVYSFSRMILTIEKNYLKNICLNDIFYNKRFIIVALIYLLITFIPSAICEYSKEYIPKKQYPVDMVKYIKSNIDYKNMRIYNVYEHGSYLMLNDIKVFIDSRSDLYLKEFNKDVSIFFDCEDIKYNFKEIDNKYKFTHYLVINDSIVNNILSVNSDTKLIKKDEYYSLYEKVTSTNV